MTVKFIDKKLKIVLNEKEMRQNPICLKILDDSPAEARAALLQIFKIACKRIGFYSFTGSLYIEVCPGPSGTCTIYYAPEQKLTGDKLLLRFNCLGDMLDFIANLKQTKYENLTAALYMGEKVYLYLNGYDCELLTVGKEYATLILNRQDIAKILEQSKLQWTDVKLSQISKYL